MTKLFPLILLFSSFISYGQTPPDKNKQKIDAECDKIMQTFSKGRFTEAIQMLKPISVLGNESIDSLTQTVKIQMSNVASSYGKITTYDFIGEQSIKNFLFKRIYLLQFERFYLKFTFTIYKSSLGWTITSFIYSEEIDELFR